MPYILRRRNLGRTSCRAISRGSTKGIISRKYPRYIPNNTDLVFRWGCTSNIPINNVVNTAEAIHTVNNKSAFRRTMQDSNPELVTKSYFDGTGVPDDAVYPLVVRPRTHSRGRQLYVANNREELTRHCRACGAGWYANQLVTKASEYRVFVVSGRAVCVAKKTPSNLEDVAWNVARGGRFDNVSWDDWPLKSVRIAIEAFNLSGLDFGGVDVMVDTDGVAYVIEINSAPSLTSPYRQECFSKSFDYIVEFGKQKISMIEDRGGYKKFIHPSVCNEAILVRN